MSVRSDISGIGWVNCRHFGNGWVVDISGIGWFVG